MSASPATHGIARYRALRCAALAAVALGAFALPAAGKSHLWRFTEFFSNADGSIQFIELQEMFGSSEETKLQGFNMRSDANEYVFPNNLEGDTAFQWMLIATQSFADLPGAPQPDFIMPENFFDPNDDTLLYRHVDTFDIEPGAMPTDGVHSIDQNGVVAVNNPINFAGETGSVNASESVPALGAAGLAALTLALVVVAASSLRRRAA